MNKPKPTYIFPKAFANAMSKIDQRTQYESAMLSMTLMSLGLIISVIYAIIYTQMATWFKVITAINGLLGVIFMWGYVIMTYQQYLSYMQFVELQKDTLMQEHQEYLKEIINSPNNQKGGLN